jgi:hypothetical protein
MALGSQIARQRGDRYRMNRPASAGDENEKQQESTLAAPQGSSRSSRNAHNAAAGQEGPERESDETASNAIARDVAQ